MFLLKKIFIDKAQIKEVTCQIFRLLQCLALITQLPRHLSGNIRRAMPPPTFPSFAMSATGLISILESKKDALIS